MCSGRRPSWPRCRRRERSRTRRSDRRRHTRRSRRRPPRPWPSPGPGGSGGSLPSFGGAELGRGRARHHQVGVDARAGELHVQRLGEQLERGLRRRVGADAERHEMRAHRRHVHDVATPALHHPGEHGEGEAHGREVVHRHHALDVVGGHGRRASPLRDTGIVHQHVDAAELRVRRRRELVDPVEIREVDDPHPPARDRSASTSARRSSRRAQIPTVAPRRANAMAVAAPMPDEAPVTRTFMPKARRLDTSPCTRRVGRPSSAPGTAR